MSSVYFPSSLHEDICYFRFHRRDLKAKTKWGLSNLEWSSHTHYTLCEEWDHNLHGVQHDDRRDTPGIWHNQMPVQAEPKIHTVVHARAERTLTNKGWRCANSNYSSSRRFKLSKYLVPNDLQKHCLQNNYVASSLKCFHELSGEKRRDWLVVSALGYLDPHFPNPILETALESSSGTLSLPLPFSNIFVFVGRLDDSVEIKIIHMRTNRLFSACCSKGVSHHYFL